MAPPPSAVLATGFSSPSPSSFPCVSTSRTPEPRPRCVTVPRLRWSSPPPRVPRRWQLSAAAEQRAETEDVGKERNHAMVTEPGCLGSCRSKGSAEFMEHAAANSMFSGSAESFSAVDWKQMLCCFDQRNLRASHIWGGLKFAFLLALFTCQVSPQALAGTDFSGAQLTSYIGDLGDITTGFASAFLLIFFSELGDKTFFIAALLAARNSGAVVFLGTFGALAAMTIVSVVLGRTFHYVDDILPFRFGESDFPIDDFAAVCLLVYFGVTTLIDAASDDEPKSKEEEKEAELAISEFSGNGAGIMAAASTVVSTFVLVFVAEWGDKSFFSTIALAAASSPLGVIGGALAGHGAATLLAVLGGSLLGTFLSEKIIAYIGGVLFLVFAAVTLVEIVT